MKERPILFSGPMVRAILDGRKKMTRRVVKYPPFDSCDEGILVEWAIGNIACPYGQKGDRLWVRETWKPINHAQRTDETYVRYAADEGLLAIKHEMKMDVPTKWRPSIFMPRWASRILLEITDVRVERLNEIPPQDCISEGLTSLLPENHKDFKPGCWCSAYGAWPSGPDGSDYDAFCEYEDRAVVDGFRILWDSINADRGFAWASNPWVWVVSFKQLRRTPTGWEVAK